MNSYDLFIYEYEIHMFHEFIHEFWCTKVPDVSFLLSYLYHRRLSPLKCKAKGQT